MPDALRISLHPHQKTITRIVHSVAITISFALAAFGVFGTLMLISASDSWLWLIILGIGIPAVSLLFFRAGLSLMRETFRKELVELTEEELILTFQYPIMKNVCRFRIDEIDCIGFAGQYDAEGNPTDQYIIPTKGDTLVIYNNGIKKSFAKDIASWEAEKILHRIVAMSNDRIIIDEASIEMMAMLKRHEYYDNEDYSEGSEEIS